jgi:1-phosphofructokinase
VIVTLTPNPSLDRTVEVPELVRGSVLRATASRLDPGGKGVNVSRALAAHGLATVALLPSGGPEGQQLAALLAPAGVAVVLVPVHGAVRSNVAVVEPDGTTTKLNEPGPVLTAAELEAVTDATVSAARGADWVVAAGSLPPGVDTAFYGELVSTVRRTGVLTAVDTSGAPLTAALPAVPDLVKPNREELAEAADTEVKTLGDVVSAAEQLRALGASRVLASLGRDGAVLVDESGPLHGEATVDEPKSTVGAGDALLAGFLAGWTRTGGDRREALAAGLAWGAAAASLPGSQMPAPHDLRPDAVRIHDRLDPDRRLED